MFVRFPSALLFTALIFNAGDVQSATGFCQSIRMLPLQDIQKTGFAIHQVETTRSSAGSASNGRSVADVERTVKPYELSPELRQTFADAAEDPGSDYDVYRSPDAALFDFRVVEGSDKCSSDIWAVRKGNHLEEVPEGPDLGEACDVVRMYGVHEGRPVMIQYAYRNNKGRADIKEIRAVEMKAEMFDDVCVVEPAK